MNTKNGITILLAFVGMFCICPICGSVIFAGLESIENETLKNGLSLLFLAFLCGVPLSIAVVGLIWQLWHIARSRVAGRKLAQAMDLEQLNQTTKQLAIWYGGQHQAHRFAIKPFGAAYSYYSNERSRTGVKFLLRIVMEVQVSQPMDVVVYRAHNNASKNPQNFDDAFDQENASRLTSETQTAMFEFVQKGYRTGLSRVDFRLSKGTRNLRLCNRATELEELLAPEVLPDTHVILIHDHPDTTISAKEVTVLLNEMASIVSLIEKSA